MPGDTESDPSLTDKIEELESLLDQQESATDPVPEEQPAIPVLDELVTAEDYQEIEEVPPEQAAHSGGDIDDLAQKLEQKLSLELDQVVHLLKGNLKNSIMEELRTELKEQADTQQDHDQQGSNNNELPK